MQHLRVIAVLIMSIALFGCGFHLRHSQSHLGAKYPAIVLPPSGSNTLYQAIYRALLSSSVNVQDSSNIAGTPRLVILSQQLTQQPLVYGPDAELRRERLRMSVVFSFDDARDNTAKREFELATERDRQLNSKQHLGDNAEKIIIEQEMQADIVSQLIRYLASRPV
ncbi:MAG: hypothetical protein BGO43_08480 [Gammaproteobacteria bacterium 39-13]|nr:hypothetical protein [Gammaproteobacteria bacterium]OJV96483.1 MAG: hypothetical protein BGO43_08480 [Gammaproteobacteria bacterium 39-13]